VWKEVGSTEEGIMENVKRSDNQILIDADALRSDRTQHNVTNYMENHKIKLGEKYERINLTLFYVFTVAKEYIDERLFDNSPEQYEQELKRYLTWLTPSQIGKGKAGARDTPQLKIERFARDDAKNYFEQEKHRDLCQYTVNGYRAHRFLCNSNNANCSWFVAEHVNPWFQDGTLVVVVKRALLEEGKLPKKTFKAQGEMAMYLETPFLFTRTTAVNPECNSGYYLEKQEHELKTKNFVTVTRLLLDVFNVLYKVYQPDYEWEAYEAHKEDFRDFVKYFCGQKDEQLERLDNDMIRFFNHFFGNVWLDYGKAPPVAAGEKYDISQDIYWSEPSSLSPNPPRVPSFSRRAPPSVFRPEPVPLPQVPPEVPQEVPPEVLPQVAPQVPPEVPQDPVVAPRKNYKPNNVIIYRENVEAPAKIAIIKTKIKTINPWQEIEFNAWDKKYNPKDHYYFVKENDIFSAEGDRVVTYLDTNNDLKSKRTNPSTLEAVRSAAGSLVRNAINWFGK